MLRSKNISKKTGEVVFFPNGKVPDSKHYLLSGTQHLKANYPCSLYNIFPYDIQELAKDNFPYMTSNTSPSPYSANQSSYTSHSSANSGTSYAQAWRAFNNNTGAIGPQHPSDGWEPASYPAWITLNIDSAEYYIYSYYMQSAASTLTSWTLQGTTKEGKTFTIDNKINQNILIGKTYTIINNIGPLPYTSFTWTFSGYVRLLRTRLQTININDYIEKTSVFYIPTYIAPAGYTAYVYIGPDSRVYS